MSKPYDFTPVPDRFIDTYMESATRTQIMVYLYLLRLKASGRKYSADDIAQDLHMTDSGVQEALSYWQEKGLLTPKQDTGSRQELLSRIEQYVGKPLSVQEMQTVYYITDDLHFTDELTDYLFLYCTDLGKRNFRYIEKTAVSWAEAGITNARQASLYVSSASGWTGRYSRGESASANKFNHFEQHSYNFDQLEKELLGTGENQCH